MNKPIIYYRFCKDSSTFRVPEADFDSAELEMTVNMLIQIDKLVQLLESPVFTCSYLAIKSLLSSNGS